MKIASPPLGNSISQLLPLITSLPRRSFSEGGSPITSLPRRNFSGGGALLTVPHWRRALFLIPLALVCLTFWPVPKAFGVSPAPDGGYSGANTAEGQNALQSLTSGVWNTALGYQTLFHETTGNQNTATGYQTLFSNTTGSLSVANGSQALYNNTTGNYNTATGFRTLYSNTTGSSNTGNGFEALDFNTTGVDNTAIGFKALYNNTTGANNTATGVQALYSNTGGFYNTANGDQALYSNTAASYNTANGYQALYSNTTGTVNTAIGAGALYSNTTGGDNTAIGGDFVLYSNTTGYYNTAIGVDTLVSNTVGSDNTAIGAFALQSNTGSNNIALGDGAGNGITTASNVIVIGTAGNNLDNSCYIGQIFGATSSGGTAVFINSNGRLGTATSSRRFKEEIKPMERASEVLFALKPVTFRYKKGIDPQGIPQFGLVAEDVEAVNPDLVVRDKEGEPYSVRYEQVNAMLLNEFLKEHRIVQDLKSVAAKQEAIIAQQQKRIDMLAARLDGQALQIQKVSAQLAVRKPASQTAFNNQ
jgi:hypothetical protein